MELVDDVPNIAAVTGCIYVGQALSFALIVPVTEKLIPKFLVERDIHYATAIAKVEVLRLVECVHAVAAVA